MSDVVYVTAEGLQKLKDELADRVGSRRMEIADRLEKAIKMGDLKENADYQSAKEDQAFNEGRVQQLQQAVRDAKVIEEQASTGIVRIGNTVTIAEEGFEDEKETYKIVGAQEADPILGFISNESPIGKALIGHRVGASVSAATPSGTMTFKILEIK